MKSIAVTDTVTRLSLYGLVNAYLVREDDGFTLIDTTLARHGRELIDAARALGAPIRRIALTHGHGDHVGSLDELRDVLGAEVTVSMGTGDARIHAGETVTDRKLTGSWPKLRTIPDVRLQAGDSVGSLEVHESPGHSPGHVAFYDPRGGVLIAGDVFTTIGGVAVSSFRHWRFPFAAMATFDPAQDVRSARTLRALEPTVLVVGHGREVRSPAAAIDAAITEAERRLPHTEQAAAR
ncbi:MAG TPA: MBL fold metallo-hydrolase [Solirubrobacteraceae bacterium]|nr:MBL fold metallo-hydrolase [Solirubrobacteraceae bacterium]